MPYADKARQNQNTSDNQRARLNALYRTRDDYPEVYESYLKEEQAKIKREREGK